MPARHLRRSERPRLRVTNEEFDELVAKALDSLPEEFGEALENVVVLVEDEPEDPDDEMLGLYIGVPRWEGGGYEQLEPDKILIFRGPLLRLCTSRRDVIAEVTRTVLHELGHYFGMEEDELPY